MVHNEAFSGWAIMCSMIFLKLGLFSFNKTDRTDEINKKICQIKKIYGRSVWK